MNIRDMNNRMQAMSSFRAQVQNGYQNSYPPQPQHDPNWERSGRDMLHKWLHDMASGKEDIPEALVQIVQCITAQQADSVLSQHGLSYNNGQDPAHTRFMETLDSLRDLPTTAEAARGIDSKFMNLTPDERKVLNILVQRTSKRRMAEKAGMPLDRFTELKHSLYHKLR